MAKIIKVTGENVSVGTDDGSIKVVRTADLNFAPFVGDEVEIYESEGEIIVMKKDRMTSNVVTGEGVVNKMTYSLLAFFLGSFGAHKFYAGNMTLGFVYLLFSCTGIPAILGIVDGIIGICAKEDSNGNIRV